MAGIIPTPRSYPSTLGDLIDSFLSRKGLRGIKVGGPILSALEAAAQSDTRNTQDIFSLLDADSLDRATGITLDRHAADEGTQRGAVTASSGKVTFSDTSFFKVATKIYPGASAPNAGTSTLKVSDASKFPSTGQIYLGRDTVNYEGPISYSAKTQVGSYWTFALTTPTQRFHDLNETVVLAQGGTRTVPAGQIVQTPQGNATTAVRFSTLYSATISDGEISVEDVQIVCQTPGVIGNVPHDAITEVVGSPFVGISVTNPLPFDNGLAAEDDNALRERIKALRQSRAKGTALALITNARGVTAKDESKTVLSASLVALHGEPASLFIDDGTGYEERDEGIALETLMDQALGGEQYFQLTAARPVAKAFVRTSLTAPFALESGAKLSVKVAEVLSEHTFETSEFRSISNATAFEVVAAINGDPNLGFSARTANSGENVVLFSRTDSNEDIEVTSPDSGIDANGALAFPVGINYTLRLYKNDRLLTKDGSSAIITSAPQSSWSNSITNGVQLRIKVDGTPATTYTFNDADFVSAVTGYTTVAATNSLEAWAAVFNAKAPGITATVAGGRMLLTSNRGNSDAAALVLSQPVGVSNNLINLGMFTASESSATGSNRDYTLDRNTGQLKLTKVLAAGDSLSAGTPYTRGYIQSAAISGGTVTIAAGGALLYLSVDGAAQIVSTALTGATTITVTSQSGNRARYAASTTNIFGNPTDLAYIKSGDWAVIWDPALNAHGVWRVSDVDGTNYQYFEVERANAAAQGATALTKSGVVFVRTASNIQTARVNSGTNRSLASIADELNTKLVGATASVYRNQFLRITTNSFGSKGDVFLAAADIEGQKLAFTTNNLVSNTSSHLAAIESGNGELGTPLFTLGAINVVSTGVGFTTTPVASSLLSAGRIVSWSRRLPGSGYETYGGNLNKHAPIFSIDGSGVITPRILDPQYTIAVSALVRVGGVVTATISGHQFSVGDVVQLWPGEGNFAAGAKVVTAVTSNTVSYAEAGSATSNTVLQNMVLSQTYLAGDRIFPTSAFAVGPYDLLTIVLDNDPTTKNYSIPLFRNVKPLGGATYSAAGFAITDTDNGGVAPSVAFGTAIPDMFADFALYMHARGKSHAVGSNKAILWRYARMGPEGERVTVEYTNPTDAGLAISLTTVNGQNAKIKVALPSGSLRSGLNLTNTTRWTAAISTVGSVDTVTYSYSKPTIAIGGLVRASGVVTGTTATAHGFSPGDVVYLTSSDVAFPAGAKTLVTASGTTFTYVEAGANGASTSGTSISSASVDPTLGSVIVGDIVTISAGSGFPTAHQGSWRVSAVTATTFAVKRVTALVAAITTPVSLNGSTNLKFYPINTSASKASDIVTWITANASSLVTAVAVENGGGSPGTGVISVSTLDEFLLGTSNSSSGAVALWPFADGVNYVQTSVLTVVPNTISLKAAVASDLVANADFDNEAMRLVPITSAAVARYLSNQAVSGFYASSEIDASANGDKVQLSSTTVGSTGAVQITGGTANKVSVAINGAGVVVDSNFSKVTIPASQDAGLVGRHFVAVQAATVMPKVSPWTSANTMTIATGLSATNWKVTFTGSPVWVLKQTISDGIPDSTVRIAKQGRFVAYTMTSSYPIDASVTEGDWVKIALAGATPVNTGLKQVVRVSSDLLTFWIENEDGIEESTVLDSGGSLFFYSYDSVQPGDTLVIDTNNAGTVNRGSWTVAALHASDAQSFYVSGSLAAASLSLTTDAPFVRVMESSPARLIKKIHTIGRNPLNSSYSDVIFDTIPLAAKMNSSAGSTIQALDKFGFNTAMVSGADAYSHATGLIGEVTRVIYGDPSNTSVYPGVVAAGANVNVSGGLVKRVQVSLAVRLRTGATEKEILERAKSAVASAINKVGLGQPIAIGALVAAAQAVDGVVAVAVLSPTYSSTNDLIAVQANEKPRVFDIAQDVLISVAG